MSYFALYIYPLNNIRQIEYIEVDYNGQIVYLDNYKDVAIKYFENLLKPISKGKAKLKNFDIDF